MNRHALVELLRAAFPDEDNRGFCPLDLIHKFGHPANALLYSELFWPTFRELGGMVFLADVVEDREDAARVISATQNAADPADVEKSFNWIEVPFLFGRNAGGLADDAMEVLAVRLAEMWSARLRACFPTRRFEVRITPADEDNEIGILFFENREPSDDATVAGAEATKS